MNADGDKDGGVCSAELLSSTALFVTVAIIIPSLTVTSMNLIYKDNYLRLNMIGRERANRALIGCDSQ